MTQRQIFKEDKQRIAKLATLTQAMREGQAKYFSITKLTSLKSLCKEPEAAHQFVFFLNSLQ
jgi:hypothetical protein